MEWSNEIPYGTTTSGSRRLHDESDSGVSEQVGFVSGGGLDLNESPGPKHSPKSAFLSEEKSHMGDDQAGSKWATFRSKAVSYNRRLECLPESPSGPLRHLSGWRMGIRLATGAILAVLLINIVLTLVAHFAFPYSGSESTLVDGSCSKTKA